MKHGPLLGGIPILKGFISGSLLAGAFTVPYGILIQLILFILAVAVFLDCLCIYGHALHILSFLTVGILSFFLGLGFALFGLINVYLVVTFVIMAILYLFLFMSEKARK